MGKETERPDPMWSDKFEDRPGEDSEDADEEATPVPPEQGSIEP